MKYRERARWGLTTDECRYIYSICQLYEMQDVRIQNKIQNVLSEVSNRYASSTHEIKLRRSALWMCLSTKSDQLAVATEFYLDQSTVSRMVKEFYKLFKKKYL